MRGKSRFVCCLLLACGLLSYAGLGRQVFASTPLQDDSFSGFAEIEGPVHLFISVSPPIARPRDSITVELTMTNQLSRPVAPAVDLALPATFSSSSDRFPSGTTFDVQHNTISWQPIVGENGDSERLTLRFDVSVADLSKPEQEIGVRLAYDGNVADTAVPFWIGAPPSAQIEINPQVVAVGQSVQLQAHTAGPGPFTEVWDLGDGRQITATNPEVAFAVPGVYEIRLQVANPLAAATAISELTVVAQPTAGFSLDDERPTVGQTIQFINESGGQRPLESRWEFGDGAESHDANPTHAYTAPGTYTVSLVVTSPHGQSEVSVPVSVGVNPTADMVLPENALTGEPIQAMAFGDDSVTSFRWDMGDGRQLEGEAVSHTYHRPGDFVVTLYAENEYATTEVIRQIHVDGGRFALYLPLVVQPPGIEGSAVEVEVPDVPTEDPAAAPPAPDDSDSAAQAEPVIPAQSGSTAPTPGGAAEGFPLDGSQPIALPPQPELAVSASTAEQLLWYVNEARRLHGLAPLQYSYELSIAAQQHTVDMAQNTEVMHVGSDGSRPAERQQRYGYLGAYGGEAVGWGWESPVPVVEFWVNSPPHRTLILNPDADQVGVGYTADGYAPNIWYWAVEFGILPD